VSSQFIFALFIDDWVQHRNEQLIDQVLEWITAYTLNVSSHTLDWNIENSIQEDVFLEDLVDDILDESRLSNSILPCDTDFSLFVLLNDFYKVRLDWERCKGEIVCNVLISLITSFALPMKGSILSGSSIIWGWFDRFTGFPGSNNKNDSHFWGLSSWLQRHRNFSASFSQCVIVLSLLTISLA